MHCLFEPGSWPNGVTHFTTTKRPIWPPPVPTHPTSSSISTTISTKYPAHDEGGGNYCGSKNGNQDQERIVGGHDSQLNEWPWIVALFNNGRQFCGGKFIFFYGTQKTNFKKMHDSFFPSKQDP